MASGRQWLGIGWNAGARTPHLCASPAVQVTTRFVAHLETNAVCDGVKGVFTSSLSILTDNLVGAAKTEFKDAVMLAVGQVVRSLVKCAVCAVRSRVGGNAAPAHDALATFHKNREMEAQVRRAAGWGGGGGAGLCLKGRVPSGQSGAVAERSWGM